MIKSINKKIVLSITALILVLGLSYIPLFYKLAEPAIFMWDEAFYAKNGTETTMNNNYIVMTEDGMTSEYNTKPPLVIWIQSLFMRIFGISTLAFRLPSAISGLMLILAFFLFFRKRFGSILMFLIASITLLCSSGYINWHVTRTGDLDAILAMLVVVYSLYFFNGLLSKKINTRFFYFMALLITLAVYTKSIAGLMVLPGLVMCAAISTERRKIFRNIHLYIAALSSLIVIALYYFLREKASPGYLNMVWNSEFIRFNNDITPWHKHPPMYFIDRFVNETYTPFIWLVPLAVIAGFLSRNIQIRKLTLYTTITSGLYLFLISFPPDKLFWYDAPLYGYFAVLIAILFYVFNEYLQLAFSKNNWLPYLISAIVACSLFYGSYMNIYEKNRVASLSSDPSESESVFAKYLIDHNKNYPYTVFYKPALYINKYQLDFFIAQQQYNNGIEIKQTDTISRINLNDMVMVCQDDKKADINKHFEVLLIDSCKQCQILEILKFKKISEDSAKVQMQ